MNDTSTSTRLAVGLAAVLGVLGWFLFALAAHNASARRLVDTPGVQLEVLPHGDARLDLAGVAALPRTAWARWTERGYLSAAPGEVIWLRVRLANTGGSLVRGVLADTSYFSDRVDAWIDDGAGNWRTAVSGDAVSAAAKPVWSRTAAFPVEVPPHGARTIYLRASDAYLAHIQPVWWAREEDFFSSLLRSVMADCACFGALAALVGYNLVLWARLRFADMGYYVLAAGASATGNFILDGGFALLGLRSGSPWHEMAAAGAFAVGGLCMVRFTRAFLGTAELLPRIDRGLRWWGFGLAGAALIVPAMAGMDTPAWLSVVLGLALLTDAACVATAIVAWRRGARQAVFFVLAYALLLVAIVPGFVSLARGDALPGTALGLLAGRTLEMILLSFAVSDRFARTQRQLVEETERRRAVEEAYADELAVEVRERTRELTEANADKDRILTVIGHDLRSPLTGLMRAAEGAPGELACEMAQKGRALLLMIEDLVLWARMRAGTRTLAEYDAGAITAPAVSLYRSLADEGRVELDIDVPEALRVRTDLVLTQTLVRNLFANALKFADSRVALGAEPMPEGVRFSVMNDGPPLPPEVARRFAAGEDAPMTATSGLGLRLCREICGALNTRLVAGTDGAGRTEFHFLLPRAG